MAALELVHPGDPKVDGPASQKRLRHWAGGFVRIARGREVFVIERRVGSGIRKKITLDVRNEEEARAELALFDRDPLNYRTAKQQRREAIDPSRVQGARLDAETLALFLGDSKAKVERAELSESHVNYTLAPYLGAWSKALAGKEIRKVTLGELKAHLRRWSDEAKRDNRGEGATHKRIVALKAFTAWLREEDRLNRAEDPTLDLKVPPVKPARAPEDRAFSAAQIQAVYAALRNYSFAPGWGDDAPKGAPRVNVDVQPIRDAFVLRIRTGMHATEIDRLARGQGKIRELKGQGEIAGVLTFPHKRGSDHAVSVDAQTLAAARRLQARGEGPSRVATSRAVARVVKAKPELDGFTFEALRHSFVTLATRGRLVTPKTGEGIPIETVAQLAGHTSSRTTRKHYLGLTIPPMAVLPLRLVNADDPKVLPKKDI